MIENASIEEFPKLQTNRNLPAGSETMFARNPALVKPEAACVPEPSAPVDGLTGNAIIPFKPVEYRNSVGDCGLFDVCGWELPFDDPPHPKSRSARKAVRDALAVDQAVSLVMSECRVKPSSKSIQNSPVKSEKWQPSIGTL